MEWFGEGELGKKEGRERYKKHFWREVSAGQFFFFLLVRYSIKQNQDVREAG